MNKMKTLISSKKFDLDFEMKSLFFQNSNSDTATGLDLRNRDAFRICGTSEIILPEYLHLLAWIVCNNYLFILLSLQDFCINQT